MAMTGRFSTFGKVQHRDRPEQPVARVHRLGHRQGVRLVHEAGQGREIASGEHDGAGRRRGTDGQRRQLRCFPFQSAACVRIVHVERFERIAAVRPYETRHPDSPPRAPGPGPGFPGYDSVPSPGAVAAGGGTGPSLHRIGMDRSCGPSSPRNTPDFKDGNLFDGLERHPVPCQFP